LVILPSCPRRGGAKRRGGGSLPEEGWQRS
jgi:hypothetical protein